MADQSGEQPVDALDTIGVQDGIIDDLLATWRRCTDRLREGDDVDVRWERGSAAKLLLQHFAVRESAKEALAGKLRDLDEGDLAGRVEGDGFTRRKAIGLLDKRVRGRQAMALNNPDVDEAVTALGALYDEERPGEEEVLRTAEDLLGPAGQRDLPTARQVRTHSTTHPSPTPGVLDKIGPLKALRALYQHLRGTPTGGTAPAVDSGREHTPGLRP